MQFDKEEVNYKVPIKERKMKMPDNFNENSHLKYTEYKEVADGFYTGTQKDNLAHGFGAVIFKQGVNHHPEITKSNGRKINTSNFLFYEGGFSGGSMNGQGILLLQDGHLQIGTFVNNHFQG
eukprot:CAMPEP_0176346740 /NCGR_PEP_ID=MMETSP0126-20121128/6474_1 /TAXON_ID=141414 ORGANISM="Strombidinopsis acuminatum, Strain SPMC142" /NCGR_SAMPLE_ID=MMETSP0126 /ASSEMBLY_ACC=CAM_ASM_000229 /LENGTH=121 /DNA_ID=CAMNT_0017694447 /DNA_START=124 /DNA_END=489 /DNA_ORIENTATION=-